MTHYSKIEFIHQNLEWKNKLLTKYQKNEKVEEMLKTKTKKKEEIETENEMNWTEYYLVKNLPLSKIPEEITNINIKSRILHSWKRLINFNEKHHFGSDMLKSDTEENYDDYFEPYNETDTPTENITEQKIFNQESLPEIEIFEMEDEIDDKNININNSSSQFFFSQESFQPLSQFTSTSSTKKNKKLSHSLQNNFSLITPLRSVSKNASTSKITNNNKTPSQSLAGSLNPFDTPSQTLSQDIFQTPSQNFSQNFSQDPFQTPSQTSQRSSQQKILVKKKKQKRFF